MDTVLYVEQARALRELGVAKRLALTASLWEHARVLKEAALRSQHADWTPSQIREEARKALQRAGR